MILNLDVLALDGWTVYALVFRGQEILIDGSWSVIADDPNAIGAIDLEENDPYRVGYYSIDTDVPANPYETVQVEYWRQYGSDPSRATDGLIAAEELILGPDGELDLADIYQQLGNIQPGATGLSDGDRRLLASIYQRLNRGQITG